MFRGGKLASVNCRGQWQKLNLGGGMAHLLWANQLSLESVAGVGSRVGGTHLRQENLEYPLEGVQSWGGAHLEGQVHAAASNLVHVGQGPAVVLATAGAQLQVLGLLQLKLEKQSHQLSPR